MSHVGSPAPTLLVLHPGAPQRHSQISERGRPGPASSRYSGYAHSTTYVPRQAPTAMSTTVLIAAGLLALTFALSFLLPREARMEEF